MNAKQKKRRSSIVLVGLVVLGLIIGSFIPDKWSPLALFSKKKE